MTDHQTSTRPERTGHTAGCSCGWGPRWAPTKQKAEEYARLHKPREKKEGA